MVHNLSELPAKVSLRYQSKVVTFKQLRFTIPARQSLDLKMDFVPRKINPDYRYEIFLFHLYLIKDWAYISLYRKEITFRNRRNRKNDQFVEVCANNVDPWRITYHSLFYSLLTPFSRNYLNFDTVIVGGPTVRNIPLRFAVLKLLN